MATKVIVPASAEDAEQALNTGSCVANFCAAWCEPCSHMNDVFAELAEEHKALRFVQVVRPVLPAPSTCLLHVRLPLWRIAA